MTQKTKPVDYVFCLPGLNFSDNYLHSWTSSLVMLQQELKCSFTWEIFYCAEVAETRNILVKKALQHNPQKIIFIDDDMVWTPEDLKLLITSNNPINTGFYLNRHNLVVAINNNLPLLPQQIIDVQTDLDLQSVGFGFIAIKKEVFDLIPYPWFQSGHSPSGTTYGEDYYFCAKARSYNFQIKGNTAIKVGHEKKTIYKWSANENT